MIFCNSLGPTQLDTNVRDSEFKGGREKLIRAPTPTTALVRSQGGPQSLNLRLTLTTHLLLKDLARQAPTGNHFVKPSQIWASSHLH